MSQPKSRGRLALIFSIIISSLVLLVAGWAIMNRQFVRDQLVVWSYQPSSEQLSLINKAGMNNQGEFIYLASEPVIDSTSNFNNECRSTETTVSILGCYVNNRIYIYDVTNEQLEGIKEVTAAHETLHAVYARLSDADKNRLNALLETEYNKLKTNQEFADLIAYYDKAEPGQRDNELFSIVGTEVSSISPELEKFYGQYFSDRQAVVKLSQKYKSVFNSLKEKANSLIAQINDLADSINNRSKTYAADLAILNSDIQTFNANLKANKLTQSQYTSQRADLVYRSNELSSERVSINKDIAAYNNLVNQYDAVAVESTNLYNSIDSTLAPAPTF